MPLSLLFALSDGGQAAGAVGDPNRVGGGNFPTASPAAINWIALTTPVVGHLSFSRRLVECGAYAARPSAVECVEARYGTPSRHIA